MKNHLYNFGKSTILTVIFLMTVQTVLPQSKEPLTLEQILTGLQATSDKFKITLAQKNEYIGKDVEERGITFPLTKENETKLRNAGASVELIGIIRLEVIRWSSKYEASGDSYNDKAEYDKAVQEYTKAIELDPYRTYSFNQRGLIYFNKGWYDQAIADFTTVINAQDYNAAPFYSRGSAYFQKGDYQKAILDFSKVITLKPDFNSGKTYYWRGSSYLRVEEFNKAINDFTKMVELDPNHYNAYNERGVAYFKVQKYDQAITDFTEVIRIRPNFSSSYNNRASAYVDRRAPGDLERAIADLRKTLELNPDNKNAKNTLDGILKARQ